MPHPLTASLSCCLQHSLPHWRGNFPGGKAAVSGFLPLNFLLLAAEARKLEARGKRRPTPCIPPPHRGGGHPGGFAAVGWGLHSVGRADRRRGSGFSHSVGKADRCRGLGSPCTEVSAEQGNGFPHMRKAAEVTFYRTAYRCSQISLIAVLSSSSIITFAKAGMQIMSMPSGAR